jgi:hypothetical protein
MPALIQRLHPMLYPGPRLMLDDTRQSVFSQQGDWDAGSALHCAAMALAILGRLSDPVDAPGYANGPIAHFWDQAWPHYLHGLTPSEFAAFVWELDADVQPVQFERSADELVHFCAGELAAGWPVVIWIVNPPNRRVAYNAGRRNRGTRFDPECIAAARSGGGCAGAGRVQCAAGVWGTARILHHGRLDRAGGHGRRGVDPQAGTNPTGAGCA